MARREIVETIDDIDGTVGANPTRFAFEGVEYEIDLADHNEEELREALGPFVQSARRIGGRRARSRVST